MRVRVRVADRKDFVVVVDVLCFTPMVNSKGHVGTDS